MTSSDLYVSMQDVPLFQGLTPDEIEFLGSRLQSRSFSPGKNLMELGQPSPGLFVIRSGLAAAIVRDATGAEREISTLGKGDCLGEMALLTGEPCSATVRAITEMEAWALEPEDFADTMDRFPGLWRNLSRILSQRLARTSRHLVDTAYGNTTALVMDFPDEESAALSLLAAVAVVQRSGKRTLLIDARSATACPVAALSPAQPMPSIAATLRSQSFLKEHDAPLDPANGLAGARIAPLASEIDDEITADEAVAVLNWLRPFYDSIIVLASPEATELRQALFERVRSISAVIAGDGLTDVPGWLEQICASPAAVSRLDVSVTTAGLPKRTVIESIERKTGRPARRLPISRSDLQELARSRKFEPASDSENLRTGAGRLARQIADTEVGLALGAGAAKGFSHIGALQVLDEAAVPIDFITGTSIGAIVATAYAGGLSLDEIYALLHGADRKLTRWTIPFRSVWSDRGLRAVLSAPAPHARFCDLDIPCAVVATDIATGREAVLKRGVVWKAVQASVTVPGMFPPVFRAGRHLVDGGLVNPVPSRTVRDLGAKVVIAVDLMSPAAREHAEADVLVSIGAALKTRIPNLVELLWRANEIMQEEVTLRSVAHADITIEPRLGRVKWSDFSTRGREYVSAGEQATREKIPEIMALLPRISAEVAA